MMLAACVLPLVLAQSEPPAMLPIGKYISPAGTHAEVGSYPLNMVPTVDGKYAVITTCGFRQNLSVVEIATGRVMDQFDYKNSGNNPNKDGLYYGLAVHPVTGEVYASRGQQDKVSNYRISPEGKITEVGTPIAATIPASRNKLPYFFAGLAFNSNGSRLMVVNNQTASWTNFQGSVTVYQTATGKPLFEIPVSGFPLACTVLTAGPEADRKGYVASERDGCLDVLDLRAQKVRSKIHVGAGPVGLLLSKSQNTLYVANSAGDSVSVVNTRTDRVTRTINLRPTALRGLPGAGPLGLALSDDEKSLYVTLGDMEAVAVVRCRTGQLEGYVPTAWLPTSVVQRGGHLLVTCAKGIQAMNPNGVAVKGKGKYIQDIIAGSVTHLPEPSIKSLGASTQEVVRNNRLKPGLDRAVSDEWKNPGIQHVIYIIKENRTYDNVLGDLKQGNGDASLTIFPRAVTPNQHALAERFVLLDNFYVCAEVSQDGWQWSLSGMTSPYISRNTPYNYSDRGRSYDSEAQNNGEPIDFFGLRDVARPASGTIWHHAAAHNVDFRNYGMIVEVLDKEDKRFTNNPNAKDSFPLLKVLVGKTDTNYRHYDLNYPDSPGYDENGNFTWKSKVAKYGQNGSTNRFAEWKREFDGFCKSGKMPSLMTVRFPNDHTMGTRAGVPMPQSQVADNDYAVGLLVEAVSHSPFWKNTLICVLEDDAQAGIDHVDAHRSTAYVISPFIAKGTVDSRFYNTDSMLRTIELALGMPPMCQYDAVATPILSIGKEASNRAPFTAIKPDPKILCKLNGATAYRAKDSLAISPYHENSQVDEDLNDILWKSIMGIHRPTPKPVYSLVRPRAGRHVDDDD